jgi:hypothetical protein
MEIEMVARARNPLAGLRRVALVFALSGLVGLAMATLSVRG